MLLRCNVALTGLDKNNHPALDLRAVAAGGVLGAGAAFLIDAALRQSSPSVGPTSAALSDAFDAFAAAALGISLGGALAAAASRAELRFAAGILGAAFGYLAILTPVFIATRASDVSSGRALRDALVGFVVALPAAVIGVSIGAASRGIASRLIPRNRRTRRSAPP